ncbi:MAG: hypothetical protein VKK62_05420 [Synechococcaceae cyanobacterium]|nr:hypothetical protein [Synechococcaceae cyanobacterium]
MPSLLGVLILLAPEARALTGVSPTGVNVRSQGTTSVFITFQGTAGEIPSDGFWCSAVQPGIVGGSVVPFNPCLPGTLLGSLPASLNLGQPSGTGGRSNFTDIMTIPETIARKAYQIGLEGGNTGFFYIRRFSGPSGTFYGVVTCRLTAGGATSPLSLINVELRFEGQSQTEPITAFATSADIRPFSAILHFNGTGRLRGTWEIAQPGDTEPTNADLLPTASLPLEQRSLAQQYRVLAPFDLFVPPLGRVVLPGPDPRLLNNGMAGDFRILLRVQATPADASLSGTSAGLAGPGGLPRDPVAAGGVAGFPIPFLRYRVAQGLGRAGGSTTGQAAGGGRAAAGSLPGLQLAWSEAAQAPAGTRLGSFSWSAVPGAASYRLQFGLEDGRRFQARLPGSLLSYPRPWWLTRDVRSVTAQITALDAQGQVIGRSAPVRIALLPLDAGAGQTGGVPVPGGPALAPTPASAGPGSPVPGQTLGPASPTRSPAVPGP